MKKTVIVLLAVMILAASLCTVTVYALSFIYEIGEDVWVVIAGSKGADDPISRLYDVQGLPDGMSLSIYNGWQIVLQGRAYQSGTYPFTYSFVTRVNKEEHIGVSDTVVINAPEVEITKYPGSETITEHASALFVASARNYSSAEWRIVDREDNAYAGPAAMMERFPGLIVEAYRGEDGREYLQLYNVPLEMNHWLVITEFHNLDNTDSVSTPYEECAVFVQEKKTAAPVIKTQPVGAELSPGTSMRLEIEADCAEGFLCYQWYRNQMESSENGIAISGANTDKYVPEKSSGTTYYYCQVCASADGKVSEIVCSDIVAVSYFTDDTGAQAPSAEQEKEAKDISQLLPPAEEDNKEEKANPLLEGLKKYNKADLIGIAGIAALLLLSGTVLIILNRRENR